jgi:hypothetical protein
MPDDDLGAPIDELRDLSLPVGAHFQQRVRNRIERRVLAGDLMELVFRGPLSAVLHLLEAPFEWFGRKP